MRNRNHLFSQRSDPKPQTIRPKFKSQADIFAAGYIGILPPGVEVGNSTEPGNKETLLNVYNAYLHLKDLGYEPSEQTLNSIEYRKK